MPGGRKAKHLTPEDAWAARLASKKAYRERNIEEERRKSRERTQCAAERAREKLQKEAHKAAKKAKRRRKIAEKLARKAAGTCNSNSSLNKQETSPQDVLIYSRKTDLQKELQATWDQLFPGTGMPDWDIYFKARYLQFIEGCKAEGVDVWRDRVKQRVEVIKNVINKVDTIITEARSRTYTLNGPRLQRASQFLDIPVQDRRWLIRTLYTDEGFVRIAEEENGLLQYQSHYKQGFLSWQ
ncbi:hypothetical protein M422DRAFT_240685 [Sphaerobolus stellatus SS14]|nr:hypothetical protein M422DRAFT_240685 [Sphaerobolus stellatus SS14]